VLAAIVRHFAFRLKPGHAVWPILQVTLRPAGGLPMVIGLRSPNHFQRHPSAAGGLMNS
jgi:hypothetical protein